MQIETSKVEARKVVVGVVVLLVAVGVIVTTLGGQVTEPERDGMLEVVLEGNEVTPV